jgi:DNA-binding NtrC family response regulator
MSHPQGFSIEFRTWVQALLATLGKEMFSDVAMVEPAPRRVICSHVPVHHRDAPCVGCPASQECPVPGWQPQATSLTALGLVSAEFSAAEDMPAFWLIGLHSPPAEFSTLADRHLQNVGRILRLTRFQWQNIENLLKESSKALGMADAMCKLGCRGASEAEIAQELDECLRESCYVRAWVLISKEQSGQFVLAPKSSVVSPGAVAELLSALTAFKELRLGDLLLLKKCPQLLARAAAALEPSSAGALTAVNAVLLPLLKPDPNAPKPAERLRFLLAAFSPGFHSPGPILDLMRLLSQLALTAWESARRLAEAEKTESIVRRNIRTLPGFEALVGETHVMVELRSAIVRAAKSDRTVLLIGEQGTGKEMVAKLIHRHSDQGDFRCIACRLADEMATGFELWKSFYPSAKSLEEMLAKEFRDVPFVRIADLSKHHKAPKPEITELAGVAEEEESRLLPQQQAGWKPKDQDLAEVIEGEESRLRPQHRYLYRSVLRRLHQAWQQNVFFNFFEYDSGAAATQQIAAELFGFADKRFTDTEGGPGRFQTASHCGGTLFLDNIHHLDLSVQRALLKATEVRHEDRRVSRAGVAGAEPVHVRIIVATTTDLRELAAEKKFLYELSSRLMCEVIPIPPLNSRREDIPLLTAHFAESRGKAIEPGAVEPLRTVDWHGMNVRGLQNIVESAAQTDQPVITAKAISRAMDLLCSQVVKEPLNNEQIMIRDAMERAGGNIQQAADAIGWSRQKLYRLLDHYGIDRRDYLRAPKTTSRRRHKDGSPLKSDSSS